MTFALAELLVAGGERVGIPGLMNPTASRNVIDKMAQAMLHDDAARLSLPPSFVPSALAEIVVLSDFWSPIDEIRTMLAGLSASGAHGTLIQIVDPAEESFPYSGRIEFVEPEGGGVITAGRAERWARDYVARVALHRDQIRSETDKLDWLFSTHTTRPLRRRTAAVPAWRHDGEQGQRAHRDRQGGAQRMIAGLPLSFAEPLLLLGLLSLPLLWWLLRVMPPRPRRIEFPPTRLLFDIAPKEETPSRTPWWLTALRLLAAALIILAAAGPIWNPQTGVAGGRTPLRDPARRRLERGRKLGHPDQGGGRVDRQCRQRPPRRRPGSAVGADARHHHHAGRHRARRVAPARAKALFDRAG